MIGALHYITQNVEGFSHAELAAEACRGGVRWVQLRLKNVSMDVWIKEARETKAVCKTWGAKLIINDQVELAREIGADGVHLGKEDMNAAAARKILGAEAIIGATANNMDDIRNAVAAGADYIGLGPYRFTPTKEKLSPLLGMEGYHDILRQVQQEGIVIPLIGIGGIRHEDVTLLMETGLYGVAVSAAINLADNRSEAAALFIGALSNRKKRSV